MAAQFEERYTPAVSRYFAYPADSSVSEWKWLPCSVISFDEDSNVFLIEWDFNGQRKKVKRLNLIFDAEDHARFFKRLDYAVNARNEFEKNLSHFDIINQKVSEREIGHLPKF